MDTLRTYGMMLAAKNPDGSAGDILAVAEPFERDESQDVFEDGTVGPVDLNWALRVNPTEEGNKGALASLRRAYHLRQPVLLFEPRIDEPTVEAYEVLITHLAGSDPIELELHAQSFVGAVIL